MCEDNNKSDGSDQINVNYLSTYYKVKYNVKYIKQ